MTAMASGCSIWEPAPRAKARGSMPQMAAMAVMTMGRRRRWAAWSMASRGAGMPSARAAFVGVEQQDAVFGDDADDHDEAHEAGDVEVGAGDEQGEDDAGDGEDGAGEDGDGGGEVAELGEQDAEDEGEGEDEHAGEVVEGLLLLLVGAAVLDADAGGQVQAGDGLAGPWSWRRRGRSLRGGR